MRATTKLVFGVISLALLVCQKPLLAQSKFGTDSVACWENTQVYYQLYKSKQYASAFESWKYVYDNCPAAYKNTFIFAPAIIEAKIEQSKDESEKQKLVSLLLESYDKRIQLFPEKIGFVYGQKGVSLMKYDKTNYKGAYETFMSAYNADGYDLPAAIFNGLFISAAQLFNTKVFSINDVFDTYNLVSEAIEKNNNNLNRELQALVQKAENGETLSEKEQKDTAKLSRELSRYDVVDANVEKTLVPIATCEKLQNIYNEESFEKNRTSPDWLRRASKMLQKERANEDGELTDCTDLPIFFKVAEANYQLEPSPTSARAVGKLAWGRKDYSKAVDYFNQAASMEIDPKKKADDFLKVAISYQRLGNFSSAKNSLMKASNLKKNWGEPYLLLASMYGSSEGIWGNNVVEKKAVYWAAIDKLNYAKSIDPEVANRANRLIASYQKQLPGKDVAFQLNVREGERINIGSWINESVVAKF